MFGSVPTLRVLAFASNSARPGPPLGVTAVSYLGSARKPWRVSWTRALPQPIAVAGDTVLTDGLLAARIGAMFVQCFPEGSVSTWPRVQAVLGYALVPVLFVDAPGAT